jgi:hypothetical protein
MPEITGAEPVMANVRHTYEAPCAHLFGCSRWLAGRMRQRMGLHDFTGYAEFERDGSRAEFCLYERLEHAVQRSAF